MFPSACVSQEEAEGSSLEGAAKAAVVEAWTSAGSSSSSSGFGGGRVAPGGDGRFSRLTPSALSSVTLREAREALVALLDPKRVEVSQKGPL